jgi:hypothetical protein
VEAKDRGVTYALQSSFFPLGPFLHSGLLVVLQLEHATSPAGRFAELRPVEACSPFAEVGLSFLFGGGTTLSVVGEVPLTVVVGE